MGIVSAISQSNVTGHSKEILYGDNSLFTDVSRRVTDIIWYNPTRLPYNNFILEGSIRDKDEIMYLGALAIIPGRSRAQEVSGDISLAFTTFHFGDGLSKIDAETMKKKVRTAQRMNKREVKEKWRGTKFTRKLDAKTQEEYMEEPLVVICFSQNRTQQNKPIMIIFCPIEVSPDDALGLAKYVLRTAS